MELMDLYRMMYKARAFELALGDLWSRGLISGEMHLGTGEEAVAAGVVSLLAEGDTVALDHRCTPVLTLLGVDMAAMLREVMGKEDGLCSGRGGHMHLFSKEHGAASSGIVGAAGPLAAGFALSARLLRPGSISVAFFGEGAANQGMLLESWNLAKAWSLPVAFVCKDNGWAITTRSKAVTGGDLVERARGLGLEPFDVDGGDAVAFEQTAANAFELARRRSNPVFIRARCPRLDGHFLGDPMLKTVDNPVVEGREVLGKVLSSVLARDGGGLGRRASSMAKMMSSMIRVGARGRREGGRDPVTRARRSLESEGGAELGRLEAEIAMAVSEAVRQALEERES